ncbi:MAG: sensor domain-containing diguanylate cyclase [Pelovirga sp.]
MAVPPAAPPGQQQRDKSTGRPQRIFLPALVLAVLLAAAILPRCSSHADDNRNGQDEGAAILFASERAYLEQLGPIRIGGGLALLIVLSLYWNLRLKRTNALLEESQRSKSVLLANLPGIAYRCRYDEQWTMEFISEGCFELTGYKSEELVHNKRLSFAELVHPADRQTVVSTWLAAAGSRLPVRLEYRLLTANQHEVWVFEQGLFIYNKDDSIAAVEGLIIDITDRKRAEQELLRISTRDDLTGLYNRRFLLERLSVLASEYKRERLDFAIIILDLDYFKITNDLYGHPAGDYVLRLFARFLTEGFRDYDLVGRFGGEEFLVAARNIDAQQAVRMLQRLREVLKQHAFEFNDSCLRVTFSAGVAMASELADGPDIDKLISMADERLYRAKKAGRDRVVAA